MKWPPLRSPLLLTLVQSPAGEMRGELRPGGGGWGSREAVRGPLTNTPKYSVSESLPPLDLTTSETAASTAHICIEGAPCVLYIVQYRSLFVV